MSSTDGTITMGVIPEEPDAVEGSSSRDVIEESRSGPASSSLDKEEFVTSTETMDLRLKISESLDGPRHKKMSPQLKKSQSLDERKSNLSLSLTPPTIVPIIDNCSSNAPDPGAELQLTEEFEQVPFTHDTSFSSTATGSRSTKRFSANIDGNNIDEEHDHYDLSIAMMLGIRFSVEKSSHEERRRRLIERTETDLLLHEDYIKTEKYVFPYSRDVLKRNPVETMCREWLHTFKFRAYSPMVFSQIRRICGVDRTDFVESLCENSNFIEFMSNSNSGEFFFYSHDGRYMIKTQTYQEIRFLRKILPQYYEYLSENPNSFITHYYGLYHVKIPHLRKNVPFVIMKSVFDTEKRIHQIFDLKGSTQGRRAKPGQAVLKDMDLIDRQHIFNIGPEKKQMIVEQLEKDALFLSQLNIMDYSLLVGIHRRKENVSGRVEIIEQTLSGGDCSQEDEPEKPNLDNLREVAYIFLQAATNGEFDLGDSQASETDSDILSPSGETIHVSFPSVRIDSNLTTASQSICGRRSLTAFDQESMGSNESKANILEYADASEDRIEVLWVTAANGISGRDDKGIESWMVETDTMQSKEIYYLGIIDILQQYNTRKYMEHTCKASYLKEQDISCVDPEQYAKRFINFCTSVLE